jgi:Pyruvate/2-oxoacid:ferredoxin oxidoreductase delta subunit/flavodoxin
MNTYSKLTIFYFSGTGNSKQIATWILEFAGKRNVLCKINDISQTDIFDMKCLDSDALIIFISPVHGFNFPKITLDFIRHFPEGRNKVVLMNTRGGMRIGSFVTPGLTGIAFMFSSVVLKLKGYKIIGHIPFDMPSSWLSVHPALTEKAVKFIHEKNYYRVGKHLDKIFNGKKDFLALRDIIQDILIAPVSLGYYLVGRYVFAKTFYASYKCDNCGVCKKQCPVKAIEEINDHPYWTFKCESCMKCMNNCPKRAIETAHGLFALIMFLLPLITSFVFIPFVSTGTLNDILMFVIKNLTLILLLWVMYRFQHLFLRKKIVGKIISFTSLTTFKFWGRYKSIPDYKWKK